MVFFSDLEKAYDTMWKHIILRDLYEFGFRGRLPWLIISFLSDRLFHVYIGSTLLEFHVKEKGVHQDNILSLILFNIKTDIAKAVLKDWVFFVCGWFCPIFKEQVAAQCHQTAFVICQQCEQMVSIPWFYIFSL